MSAYGALLLGVVLGWAVPWLLMRMLAPSLAAGVVVRNYRGREVFLGLGIVWLVWAGCAIVGGVLSTALQGDTRPSVLPILTLAGPLALVAFALGMVDDALGSRAARGFRGHLSALKRGTLTTGGLKLLGISAASLVVALVMAEVSPWGASASGAPIMTVALSLLAGAAIALTSNFVNLTDLRPGRALKVSSVLLVAGALSAGVLLAAPGNGAQIGATTLPARLLDTLALAVFVLGPLAAVAPYDLGERGMLGDAGANPMGAVAGLLIVSGLPLWGLVLYLVAVFALNLTSERVSFSAFIEARPFLKRLDMLGRAGDVDDGSQTSGKQPHETDSAE